MKLTPEEQDAFEDGIRDLLKKPELDRFKLSRWQSYHCRGSAIVELKLISSKCIRPAPKLVDTSDWLT